MSTFAVLLILAGAIVLLLGVLLVLRARRRVRGAADDAELRSAHADRELSPMVERLIGEGEARPPRRLQVPPRAPSPGRVPGPGVLEVAGVDLPSGRPTRPVSVEAVELVTTSGSPTVDSAREQLWVGSRAGDHSARWRSLAAGFAGSGLWPLLLPEAGDVDHPATAWYDEPARRADPVSHDPAARFALRLAESLADDTPLADTSRIARSAVSRGELGRGSARRTDALAAAFADVGDAHLALAPARRPADVLHALVWPGAAAAGIPTDELADLLASWEERYGALLVALGERSVVLAVLRPPATEQEAIEALAEQHALCPDEALDWLDDATGARSLVNAPVWRLSWH